MAHQRHIYATCQDFKLNVEDFGYELAAIIKQKQDEGIYIIDPYFFQLGVKFVSGGDAKDMLEAFLLKSFDSWDRIHEVAFSKQDPDREGILARNREFFASKLDALFPIVKIFLGEDGFSRFSKLFTEPNMLTPKDVEYLWEFLETQVIKCIKYIHFSRAPYCMEEDGGTKNGYHQPEKWSHIIIKQATAETPEEKKEVNIVRLAEKWNISKDLDYGNLSNQILLDDVRDALEEINRQSSA